MEVRLQKFLADAGIASRRASEVLISEGKVKVNDVVVTELGTKINPKKDKVKYNDELVKIEDKLVYFMLNKPIKCVTTASDEKGRLTVVNIVNVEERVFPVGRLDYMTSGLLIMTNDGDLTYKLTHPKHNIDKKYIATITPKTTKDKINILTKGVDLGDYKTSPCSIRLIENNKDNQVYEVVIHEGKNRQVRRMFEHIGVKVTKLKRIAIGDLRLGGLKQGDFRKLTKEEIKYLKRL